MTIEAVFLDRDGTIGGSHLVEYPGEFKFFSYTDEIIQTLKNRGIKVFSFTNQPGISRGESTIEAFTQELEAFGFDAVYICPHHPKENCICRKPSTGMLEKAARDHDLDLHNCAVIGDRWTDIEAANNAGCIAVLVMTGSGRQAFQQHHNVSPIQPDYIAEDLKEGIRWLFR